MRHIVMHKSSDTVDMLHGPLISKIILFAMPIAITSTLQQLFNAADIIVCGRFVGKVALAAVGANSQIIGLCINSFLGLSVGANVMIANYIGAGKTQKIYNVVHTAMTFAIIFGICIMILGLFFSRNILVFLGTPEDVLNPAILYLKVVFIGMPFSVIYNFGAAVLRSIGDTKRPLILLTITGALNLVLNVFFVIKFKMGVEGVALATSISNVISAIVIIILLVREKSVIHYEFGKFLIVKDSLMKIMKIGIPSAVQGMVFSISNLCVQSAINSLGTNTVAASTAALNLEFFPYFMISAFGSACLTFMSQNFGANEFDRCRKVVKYCIILSFASSAILSTIILIFSESLLSIFTNDPEIISIALERVYYVCFLNWVASLYEILSAAIRVMKHPVISAVIIIIGTVIFRFIWIFTIFPLYNNFISILLVYPLSWIIINIAMIIAYRKISKVMLKSIT